MSEISDEAVRAFLKAETPGLLDEHLDLAVKSVDGDKIRAGLAAALPYLLEQDRAEDPSAAEDRRVIACNYTEGTNVAAEGALAYLSRDNLGNGDDRIVVLVRSRGHRWVRKWEDIRRLGNFRGKTLPPEHPLFADERVWTVGGYEEQTLAQLWAAAYRCRQVPSTTLDAPVLP